MTEKALHEIRIDGREKLTVGGVDDVVGFDEENVVVSTCMGILNIEGEDLHISKLDVGAGVLDVSGRINAVYYTEPQLQRRGLLSLFKR